MKKEKLAGGLHKASSVLAIIGSVAASAAELIATAPPGVGRGALISFLVSGILGALGFGAKR